MQTLDHPHDAAGSITGSDTLNLIGQYFPRTVQGTFTVGSDCRGTGSYADSLGNEISFVFTAVNDGDTLFCRVLIPVPQSPVWHNACGDPLP